MSEINQKETAKRIKQLRLERKWTQEVVADKIQGSPKYYCGMEKCKVKINRCYIERLAKVFGVEFDDIAVYKKSDDEAFRDEIQKMLDSYNIKNGLTLESDVPLKNMKELISTFPFCIDFGIVLFTIKKLGYECYPFETKWNNDVVTLSYNNNSFEWNLTKYLERIKEVFKDDLVFILMEGEKIEGILPRNRICELEHFFISGLQGIIDGTRRECAFLLKGINLSEKERLRTIKVAKKAYSSISDYFDSQIELVKQIRDKVIEFNTKIDKADS